MYRFLERAYPCQLAPERQGQFENLANELLELAMQVTEFRLDGEARSGSRSVILLAACLDRVRAQLSTDVVLPLLGFIEGEVLRIEEWQVSAGKKPPGMPALVIPGRI